MTQFEQDVLKESRKQTRALENILYLLKTVLINNEVIGHEAKTFGSTNTEGEGGVSKGEGDTGSKEGMDEAKHN